jgi:hypothetical protein
MSEPVTPIPGRDTERPPVETAFSDRNEANSSIQERTHRPCNGVGPQPRLGVAWLRSPNEANEARRIEARSLHRRTKRGGCEEVVFSPKPLLLNYLIQTSRIIPADHRPLADRFRCRTKPFSSDRGHPQNAEQSQLPPRLATKAECPATRSGIVVAEWRLMICQDPAPRSP